MTSINLLDEEYESSLFSEPMKPTRVKSPIPIPVGIPLTPSSPDSTVTMKADSMAFDPLHAVTESEEFASETKLNPESDFRLRSSFIYSSSLPLQSAHAFVQAVSPTPSINILDAPEDESFLSPPPSLKPHTLTHSIQDPSPSSSSSSSSCHPHPISSPFPFESNDGKNGKVNHHDYSIFDPLNPKPFEKKRPSSASSPLDEEEPFHIMMIKPSSVSPIFEKNELELKSEIETILGRWKSKKENNLRALLISLDANIWPLISWPVVGLADLMTETQVKMLYMKIIAKVHPDKWQTAGRREKWLANGIFCILNEAWESFKNQTHTHK